MKIRFFLFVIGLCSFAHNVHAQRSGEFSLKATPLELLGSDAKENSDIYDQNRELTWHVYVPKSYDPSKPAGILVYVGSQNEIGWWTDSTPVSRKFNFPDGWRSVTEDKNLIWVNPGRVDSVGSIFQKILNAKLSALLIEKEFRIDKSRIYIAGEGRTSARASLEYTDVFNGAIFLSGGIWEESTKSQLHKFKDKRIIFRSSRPGKTYKRFKEVGEENVVLFKRKTTRRNFARMIDFLDGEELPKKYTKE